MIRDTIDTNPNQELYDTYEQEYNILLGSLSRSLRSSNGTVSIDTNKDIKHAQSILESMKSELEKIPSTSRFLLQSRLIGYQRELDSLKRELSHRDTDHNDIESIQSGTSGAVTDSEQDQKKSLLSGSQMRMDDQNRRLQDANQLAHETEEIGISILSNLRTQREQIEHTTYTLHETEGHLEKSRRLLRKMARRLLANKIVTSIIVLLLLVAIGLLIYFKVYLNS